MKDNNIIFNNFGLKITAIFLAILVWIIISGKERAYSERTLAVNVEYFNETKEMFIRNVYPEKVRIKIKGTSKEINKVSPEDIKLKIDLKGITESTKLNRFAEDYLELPENINVESVYPQWIEITVEEYISKEVPVRIIYKGKLKKGIRLIRRKVTPDKIKIFGYKSQIQNINTVYAAENINLSEITENKTIKIPLKKGKEILKFEGSDEVEVSIVVERKNE